MSNIENYSFTPKSICIKCSQCKYWHEHYGCCKGQEVEDIIDETICTVFEIDYSAVQNITAD